MKTIRVVAAVIREKDKIFATARGYGEFKGGWEFPGGKIEVGETSHQALVREIKEELEADIEVGELIDTIEYDYPTFHLSMDCFWAKVVSGELVLKEASDSKWLRREELDSIDWLPADITIIAKIKNNMRVREMLNRKVSVEKINENLTSELWGEDIHDSEDKVIKWCYTDVLYSFKSMYLLGIKAFYPELVDVCEGFDDCPRVGKFVELLNFRHFARFCRFDRKEQNTFKKSISDGVNVSVVLDVECGNIQNWR